MTPGNRAYLDVEVLDPAGERAEPTLIPDTYYGQGVDPATTGIYTVRLSVAREPALTSGVLWISTPQEVPIEVDGEPAELQDDLRPGQARWLTFDRSEGELFTVGCEPSWCADGLYLVSRESDNQFELGQVGPTFQAMWNPPRDGAYYLSDEVTQAHRVWLTSADPKPSWVGGLPERVNFTRPGQSHGITVEVVEGQQYAVSAIDRGLVNPEEDRASFEVAGFAPLGTSGFVHASNQRGSSLTTFRARSTGTWTIYLDPDDSAIGPMDLQVVRIDDQ